MNFLIQGRYSKNRSQKYFNIYSRKCNEAKLEFLENNNLSHPNNEYEKLNSSEIKNLYQNISNAILAVENDNSLGEIEREMYNTQLETRIKNC